jgi:hypothetical protein
VSPVSLPMNDPIPPRPRAAITGDSRLGTHGSSRPPASRPRQHAHHRATARAVPTAGHRGPRYASTFFIARRGEAGVAACVSSSSRVHGGSSPWNPPACARGTSCPHPRRHPAAAPSARHLPTTHSTREDRSEPIAGAVSGAARLALHRHAVCHHRGGRGVRALRRLMGRSS